jgi:hypothetical protein
VLPTRAGLWNLVYAAIGLGNFFMLAGLLFTVVPRRGWPLVLAVLALRLLAYVVFTMAADFRYVMYDLVLTLSVLLGTALYGLHRGEPSAPFVLSGVLLSLLGALFQTEGIDLHPRFNHNDLFTSWRWEPFTYSPRRGFASPSAEPGGLRPIPYQGMVLVCSTPSTPASSRGSGRSRAR